MSDAAARDPAVPVGRALPLDPTGRIDRLVGVALGDRPGRFDLALDGERIGRITASSASGPAEWLALPAFVNFHAHANRAFVAPAQRPASFAAAIEAARLERASASRDDIARRARHLLERSMVHGTALVRTHTDVDTTTGLRAIEGVLDAASEMAAAIDVEIVAFASAAVDPIDRAVRDLLTDAVGLGAALLGAVPALYARPLASAEALFDLAIDLDVGIDLHLDEHLDAAAAVIEPVVDAALERGIGARVAISHGCVLSALDEDSAGRILDKMARAGIALVVQPALNLYLQDRGAKSPRQRGLAPVRDALQAGVPVRFGTDNIGDWFFPWGDADPLDEGYIGALAAQLDDVASLTAAMCGGRSALHEGDRADLVLVPARSFDDALARRPAGRKLLRRGRLVAPPRA